MNLAFHFTFRHFFTCVALVVSIASVAQAHPAHHTPMRFPVGLGELKSIVHVEDLDGDGLLSAGDALSHNGARITLRDTDLASDEAFAAVLSHARQSRVAVLSFSGKRYIVAGKSTFSSGGLVVTGRSDSPRVLPLETTLPSPKTLRDRLAHKLSGDAGLKQKLARYAFHFERSVGYEAAPTRVFEMHHQKAWKLRWQVGRYVRHQTRAKAILDSL